jgi:hypothetical protein
MANRAVPSGALASVFGVVVNGRSFAIAHARIFPSLPEKLRLGGLS